MLNEMMAYHRHVIEAFLFVVCMNLILPFLLKQSIEKMVFWSRIGYFTFWALWSMGIFTGLIVFMFTLRELTISVIIMIAASVALGLLDGYRSIKSRRIWMSGGDAIKFSSIILLIEIAIIAAVTVIAIKI